MILIIVVYALAAVWLAVYGLNSFVLAALYWRHRRERVIAPSVMPDAWPCVTVQLPVYNERHVVERLVDAVAALDYPRDRLQIQVLDDSTDDTVALARARVEHYRHLGTDIVWLRRPDRTGYKAGALAWGLDQARGELIAVFDADFRPQPDFLRRTVPYLAARPELGFVQARWTHLNDSYSLLTRAEALALDGHFVVEQAARNRSSLLMNFNGTAGVWRRACIEDSGGWQADTMSEDLDLSYRAQLRGWQCLYLPDVTTPAELPPQIAAFKRQQARWARGSTQVLRKLARSILSSRLSLGQKVFGLIHVSSYLAHPLMLLLLLVSLPLLLWPQDLQRPLALLGLVSAGPPLVYALSQAALYRDWKRRFLAFPVLMLVGVGVSWSNTQAVLAGLVHWGGTFMRTPKFQLEGKNGRWAVSNYRLALDPTALGEVALAAYALATATATIWLRSYAMLPFMLLYVAGFATVIVMGVWQAGPVVPLAGRQKGEVSHAL